MSFSSASIYYYEANASTTYSVVSALPKVSDSYIYTTPFTGNLKTYNYYVELNNFSSDKYVQAFNKYNMTINKRPIVFSFNIPESLNLVRNADYCKSSLCNCQGHADKHSTCK